MDIDSDFKQALFDKNEIAVSAIRNLKADIKNAEIAAQTKSGRASPTEGGQEKLTESELLEVVRRKVKQHKDSIESFRAGNREDLVVREQQQMAVLLKYLPKQMDEAELRSLVGQVVIELGAKAQDFGKVMKEVMARTKGAADGSVISKLVKEILR
ncbi:MAG: GatB/YqeY domain-containing protein [Candidatus Doudnabacteria bacterium]|nr:GatB/YqeY domain-containing protein [Candidatus Doudnabacteria bacterium]